jgi:signal transduction histidine kinase
MTRMTRAGVGPGRQHASLRSVLQLIMVGVVVAIGLNVAAAALLGRDLRTAAEQLDRDVYVVQRNTEGLYRSLVDQQNDVRAYTLTDDRVFLQDYDDARRAQDEYLERLSTALVDDPASRAALGRVAAAARAWQEQGVQPQIDAAQRQDGSLAPLLRSGTPRRLFAQLNDQLVELNTVVDARAAGVLDAARDTHPNTLWLLFATLLVTAGLAALSLRVLTTWVSRPMRRLVEDASAVAGGDLHHEVGSGGPTELRDVGEAVDAMRRRLLAERSTAARRSLLTGQEDERRRLAMGIHDDTVQSVLAASLRLQRLRRFLRGSGDEGVKLVEEVQQDLDEAISRLRRLIFELHPPTLDREGLAAAMRLYLAETLEPEGVRWSLDVHGSVPRDPVTIALAYRLFREAVLNVVRHARASRVRVDLRSVDEILRVEVADDGVGFEPGDVEQPAPGHLGMLASRQLCEAAGGDWDVESAPGRGTRVRYAVPQSVA